MVDRQESGDSERASQSIRVAPPRLSASFRRAPSGPPDSLLKALTGRVTPSANANLDNHLKQWELVEGDKGLRVVEKRSTADKLGKMINREEQVTMVRQQEQQQQPSSKFQYLDERLKALKAFERSKILPLPVLRRPEPDSIESNVNAEPISLDVILNQRKGCQESTDTLKRLEQQVKAIEMGTIADRARQRESSNDIQPEVQLRYREHEDLLRNVTDDEADG